MRGETGVTKKINEQTGISIHSPHARGDLLIDEFNRLNVYFNPLPSCEGRHGADCKYFTWYMISIHSPHARGDYILRYNISKSRDFNPLPSCEGRQYSLTRTSYPRPFQSTPLMRGETCACTRSTLPVKFQSTPLMRGETHRPICKSLLKVISIHSPHARGDPIAFLPCA